MKKITLLFVITIIFTSCDPPQYANKGDWYVKNSTNQTLTLIFFPQRKTIYSGPLNVAPRDSIKAIAFVYSHTPSEEPYFDKWIEANNNQGIDTSIKVFSESGHLLKEWNIEDRYLSGKEFYKESSWKCYRYRSNYNGNFIGAKWVFEILPEDLIEEEEHSSQ